MELRGQLHALGHFTQEERQGIHWIEGCVNPIGSQNTAEKIKL
jgi:hypothetical protein